MEIIYKVLFLVGVVYTIATFLLGHLLDSVDVDLDGDLPGLTILPIKPIAIVIFITVFGGVGMIGGYKEWSGLLTFIIALFLGLVISNIVYRFIIIPLKKVQTNAVKEEELIGTVATVISTIFENGFGTIAYTKQGNRYNSPAKHIEGKKVLKGAEVSICDIKNKVFYVDTINIEDKL